MYSLKGKLKKKKKNLLQAAKYMLIFVTFWAGGSFVFLLVAQTHPYSKLGVFLRRLQAPYSQSCVMQRGHVFLWLAQYAFPGGQGVLPFFIRMCVLLPCQIQVKILAFTCSVCSFENQGYLGVTLKGVMKQMVNLKTLYKCSGVSKIPFLKPSPC